MFRPLTQVALLLTLLMGTSASAAFLTPEAAGFGHCQVMTNATDLGAGNVLPYVARVNAAGAPERWLMDAFLVAPSGTAPSGAAWASGLTSADDWRSFLKEALDKGNGLCSVQDGVDEARRALGAPTSAIMGIITVPYLSTGQTNFGDIDGDGRPESARSANGRAAILQWYVDEATSMLAAARLRDVKLWGFAYDRPILAQADATVLRQVAETVHARRLKLLWLSELGSPSVDRWSELGVDAAVLRPGLASRYARGARADRLIEAADAADSAGMGLAIETPSDASTSLGSREVLQASLAYGAPTRAGYGRAALVHVDAGFAYRQLALNTDADARAAYDQVCAFVAGEDQPLPGVLGRTTAKKSRNDVVSEAPPLVDGQVRTKARARTPMVQIADTEETIILEFQQERALDILQLSAYRERGVAWQGIIRAEAQTGGTWSAVGWCRAVVPGPTNASDYKAIIDVPIHSQSVRAVKLHFARHGAGRLALDEILAASDPLPPTTGDPGIAVGAAYWIAPDVARTNADEGSLLTDGAIGDRSVGWAAEGGHSAVLLDLGGGRAIETIRVHCEENLGQGVLLPRSISAEVYNALPDRPYAVTGPGEAPDRGLRATALVQRGDATIAAVRTGRGGGSSQRAQFDLTPVGDRIVTGRYVVVRLAHRGALMVSEIEVMGGGRNVAAGAKYTLSPTPMGEGDLPDDGWKLTNGRHARNLDPSEVVRLTGDRSIVVDLGVEQEIGEIAIEALTWSAEGLTLPQSIAVAAAQPNGQFRALTSVTPATPATPALRAIGIRVTVAERPTARFLRITLRPGEGDMAISEVRVR